MEMSSDQDSAINAGQDLVPWKWSYPVTSRSPRQTHTDLRIDLSVSQFARQIEFTLGQLRSSMVDVRDGAQRVSTLLQGITLD